MQKGKDHSYGKEIEIVKERTLLGILLDSQLKFTKHIDERRAKGFAALRSISDFTVETKGCRQDIFMQLYRSWVLPRLEFGCTVNASATNISSEKFGQLQRAALLRATGCIHSTSTEALEVLTDCEPFDLHIKTRQAQEYVRILSKYEDSPIYKDLVSWQQTMGREKHSTVFSLLSCRFREPVVRYLKIE